MPPVRFLILSSARSGSTFLVGLLRSHPQVRCEGEIFHDQHPDKIFWAEMQKSETSQEMLDLRDSDPAAFLDKYIYQPDGEQVSATGFKIFYYHAVREDWAPVWSALQADKDLRVIHLIRRNQLARVLSDKIANQTNQWFSLEENSESPDLTVHLDPDRCKKEFERAARDHAKFADAFAGHPMLELSYEDLAADLGKASELITGFLSIESRDLCTGLKKQNRRPAGDVIENYGELADYFKGTAWARFFAD